MLIYEDSQGSITLATNPLIILVLSTSFRYHPVRDAVSNGDVKIEYKSTGEMIADREQLLASSPKDIYEVLRMQRETFVELCQVDIPIL